MAQPQLWLPAMFTEPRRRSWPHEPTRLEILATRMGLDDETFRQLLHDEIERRRRAATPPPDLPGSNGGPAVSEVDPVQ